MVRTTNILKERCLATGILESRIKSGTDKKRTIWNIADYLERNLKYLC